MAGTGTELAGAPSQNMYSIWRGSSADGFYADPTKPSHGIPPERPFNPHKASLTDLLEIRIMLTIRSNAL